MARGTASLIIGQALDSCHIAIEIYNKPRTSFRVQTFIVMMIIAWTKMFHAFFYTKIGNKYFYKKGNGRYVKQGNGEKKAWGLSECIKQFKKYPEGKLLTNAIQKNLTFLVELRNIVEHRPINQREMTLLENELFYECQLMIQYFDTFLGKLFGNAYKIQSSLLYALQFSSFNNLQSDIRKKRISKNFELIKSSIREFEKEHDYRIKFITSSTLNSLEGSHAVLKIDTIRNDESINPDAVIQVKEVEKVLGVVSAGTFKPGDVCMQVSQSTGINFTIADNAIFCYLFSIRPMEIVPYKNGKVGGRVRTKENIPMESEIIKKYCQFSERHNDYGYTREWIDLLICLIDKHTFTKDHRNELKNLGKFLDFNEYQ